MTPNSALKAEAEKIIEDLNLLRLLAQHDEPRFVGSVALDLSVKLDIDIHPLVQTPDLLSVGDHVYRRLPEHQAVQELRLSDHRRRGRIKGGIDR